MLIDFVESMTMDRMRDLIKEAKGLHAEISTHDTFMYLRLTKSLEKFQKIGKRVELKNKVKSHLEKKIGFYKDVKGYEELIVNN